MICILAIGITPVSFYHDLLSDHKDHNVQHAHSEQNEVATAGINCHINDFVADKNYFFVITSFEFQCPAIACFFVGKPAPDFYTLHHFYAELRGPPALI